MKSRLSFSSVSPLFSILVCFSGLPAIYLLANFWLASPESWMIQDAHLAVYAQNIPFLLFWVCSYFAVVFAHRASRETAIGESRAREHPLRRAPAFALAVLAAAVASLLGFAWLFLMFLVHVLGHGGPISLDLLLVAPPLVALVALIYAYRLLTKSTKTPNQ